MAWYYVADGQQVGPLSEEEFEAAVAGGRIAAETLVWQEGMENWVRLGELRAGAVGVAAGGAQTAEAGEPGKMVWCAECGRPRPEGETITYGSSHICAECKATFVQRIKEGGRLAGEVEFAGFGIRAGALLLDVFIIATAMSILVGLVGAAMGRSPESLSDDFLAELILSIPLTAFEIFMLLRFGGTPGKLLLGLRVISEGGGELSFGQACARSLWSTVLTAIPYWVGTVLYILECSHAAFDGEKRAVHDIVCRTRVIRRR